MEMWNWLMECYKDGSYTLNDLEHVMTNDYAAHEMFEEFTSCSSDFFPEVRDEVAAVLDYLKKKWKDDGTGRVPQDH
jgi:hypothetical protein